MKALKPIVISGREVLPLVEGGKGVAVSNGRTSGSWAAAGGVGTFSGVNPDSYDEEGHVRPPVYRGRTRRERHDELVAFAITGGITQARIAHEIAGEAGRIHINVLWEMGGCERVLDGILEGAKGLIHGVTCGAGMPYRVADICAQFGVYYYPIVSSARAFRALWKRSYHRHRTWLGGVVYEDPWLAGGHNGLSNGEDPRQPQNPFGRVLELRRTMREVGCAEIPIFMAGGVWCLREWEDWIDNPDLGPIAFQFGTRPLLTQESPISDEWKRRLVTLKAGDVMLHRFSPTGFYSSAVRNAFLEALVVRASRQIPFASAPLDNCIMPFSVEARGRQMFIDPADQEKALAWVAQGLSVPLRTPDSTLIFVTPEDAATIHKDQVDCMGCLSACHFSNWSQNEAGGTGKAADPRSFCIQKTLQAIAHSSDIEHELMFAGHNVFRFGEDPFYNCGFVPTVKQLVERLVIGD
ncbi:MAG: nitronate monooxygenase [Alphaproteobacteria bacterium]|nr:nitronate monooxygenase [Alphaproteobacteria bacterium]